MKTKNLFQQNQPQVRVVNESRLHTEVYLQILESVHKPAKATATVPCYSQPRSLGTSEQQ